MVTLSQLKREKNALEKRRETHSKKIRKAEEKLEHLRRVMHDFDSTIQRKSNEINTRKK